MMTMIIKSDEWKSKVIGLQELQRERERASQSKLSLTDCYKCRKLYPYFFFIINCTLTFFFKQIKFEEKWPKWRKIWKKENYYYSRVGGTYMQIVYQRFKRRRKKRKARNGAEREKKKEKANGY